MTEALLYYLLVINVVTFLVITQDSWMSCRVKGTPLNDAMLNVLQLVSQCSEMVQQHPVTIQYIERLNKLPTRPQEGDRFRDFAVEYDDKTTRLSDFVGRDKYVLVGF